MTNSASATHIVFDARTVERLRSLSLDSVVRALDTLLLGPSRRDPLEHACARRLWWRTLTPGDEEEWDQLYLPSISWTPPVVIWASASPVDRLHVWRACSWLRDRGLKEQDVRIVELDPVPRRVPRDEPFDCLDTVAHHRDESLLAALSRARPWTRARHARAVDLWRRFVAPDPIGFARRCAREAPLLWALLGSFFPRVTASGLRLGRFDELLLRAVGDRWQTAVRVYVHDDPEWLALGCCAGDVWLPYRLDQWAACGAIERQPGPKPETRMLSHVYRLTPLGARLLERLDEPAAAPPLPIGGAVLYAGPWALRDDGRLVRL